MFGKQRMLTVAITIASIIAIKKFAPLPIKKYL